MANASTSTTTTAPLYKQKDEALWSWVGEEVTASTDINDALVKRVYYLDTNYTSTSKPYCPNYLLLSESQQRQQEQLEKEQDQEAKDLQQQQQQSETKPIVIHSDTDDLQILEPTTSTKPNKKQQKPRKKQQPVKPCHAAKCKDNPNCLNHLGQNLWEAPDAFDKFCKARGFALYDPVSDKRDQELPVGLKNLGATCYLNTILQIWYHNLEFRKGIYEFNVSNMTNPDTKTPSPHAQIYTELQKIFTYLQLGPKTVYDPRPFIEALQLNPSEQQDTQEFYKLFISMLSEHAIQHGTHDTGAKSLQSLIQNQFEGTCSYITECKTCGYKSIRGGTFSELELTIQDPNATNLTDSLQEYIRQEQLNGDNQYYCESCGMKRDAIRYTRLDSLPKVLSFQLLRFSFDLKTLSKRKMKTRYWFPASVNMASYLNKDGGQENDQGLNEPENEDLIYDLSAVLIHKGPSAFSGHYITHVFDEERQQWFLLDDERVELLHEKSFDLVEEEEPGADETNGNTSAPSDTNPAQEDTVAPSEKGKEKQLSSKPKSDGKKQQEFSSRNAYMLIYTQRSSRKSRLSQLQSSALSLSPPKTMTPRIQEWETEYTNSLTTYQTELSRLRTEFDEKKQFRSNLYRTWDVASDNEFSYYVPTHFLKTWLQADFKPPATEGQGNGSNGVVDLTAATDQPSTQTTMTHESLVTKTHIEETHTVHYEPFICQHGKLKLSEVGQLKRVNADAGETLLTTYAPVPRCLTTDDLCRECVVEVFEKAMGRMDHENEIGYVLGLENDREKALKRLLKDGVDADEAQKQLGGVWISKEWFFEWKKKRPNFQIDSVDGIPSPDHPVYLADTHCQHNRLTPEQTTRRAITNDSFTYLQQLFPSFKIYHSVNEQPCASCLSDVEKELEKTRDIRELADLQKTELKAVSIHRQVKFVPGETYYLVSNAFLIPWREWLRNPTTNPKPTVIDNSHILCEHGNIPWYLNSPEDLNELERLRQYEWGFGIVNEEIWRKFCAFYETINPISFIHVPPSEQDMEVEEEEEEESESGSSDKPTSSPLKRQPPKPCSTCRIDRKLQYDTAILFIRRVEKATSPVDMTESSTSNAKKRKRLPSGIVIGNRRQRTRTSGDNNTPQYRPFKLQVSSDTTIKDLKVDIMSQMNISPIAQRLFYQSRELVDNSLRLVDYRILPNSEIELEVLEENESFLNDDDIDQQFVGMKGEGSGSDAAAKNRRVEEGFKGTSLLGRPIASSSTASTSTSRNDRKTEPMEVDTADTGIDQPMDEETALSLALQASVADQKRKKPDDDNKEDEEEEDDELTRAIQASLIQHQKESKKDGHSDSDLEIIGVKIAPKAKPTSSPVELLSTTSSMASSSTSATPKVKPKATPAKRKPRQPPPRKKPKTEQKDTASPMKAINTYFSPLITEWACQTCTFLNSPQDAKCQICGAAKPEVKK